MGHNSFQMPYMDLVSWQIDFPRETPDPEPEIVSAEAPVSVDEA